MTGDRAFALDAASIALASTAICAAAQHLAFMTAVIVLLFAIRTVLWLLLPRRERDTGAAGEIVLLGICTLLGAANDLQSVVVHRVYDYYLPVSIPLWMLLYWGLILRFVLTLFAWRRLSLPQAPRSLPLLGLELALVVATRQAIYRLFLDPWLSWLPFAAALVIAAVALRPTRRELVVLGVFALGGTATEVAYIQLGGLHRYHLGWIGGVPLWIALWWPLAALVWADVGRRIVRTLNASVTGAAPTGTATP